MSTEMPIMNLSWQWNAKRKYKFYVLGAKGEYRRFLRVWFSKTDQSIYAQPLYERNFVVQTTVDGTLSSVEHRAGLDFHLSLHESGVVNLSTSDDSVRLRKELSGTSEVRHIVTIQINSIGDLPVATQEEINNPKQRYLHLPISGFPTAPLMLTVYCAKETANWSPPSLGNSMMIHYKTLMRGKDYNFHFVQWQDLAMPKGEGDIGIQFGGENDGFYGV